MQNKFKSLRTPCNPMRIDANQCERIHTDEGSMWTQAQAGPRPSLAPDISRTEVRPAWDAQTAHPMRTSRKVQAYFGAPDAVQAGCKRKGESQGEHSAKRPNSSTVGSSANVLPVIFAKCPVLARRFPSLAG